MNDIELSLFTWQFAYISVVKKIVYAAA